MSLDPSGILTRGASVRKAALEEVQNAGSGCGDAAEFACTLGDNCTMKFKTKEKLAIHMKHSRKHTAVDQTRQDKLNQAKQQLQKAREAKAARALEAEAAARLLPSTAVAGPSRIGGSQSMPQLSTAPHLRLAPTCAASPSLAPLGELVQQPPLVAGMDALHSTAVATAAAQAQATPLLQPLQLLSCSRPNSRPNSRIDTRSNSTDSADGPAARPLAPASCFTQGASGAEGLPNTLPRTLPTPLPSNLHNTAMLADYENSHLAVSQVSVL